MVELSQNPHFYPRIDIFSDTVSINPFSFTQTLSKMEKLEDLEQQMTSGESHQRPPPKSPKKRKADQIHTLTDDGNPIIITSEDRTFYKNISNVWTTMDSSQMSILKGMTGLM